MGAPLINFVNTSKQNEQQNACRPRITRPRYDHCDTVSKQVQRLSLISPWIDRAMEYAPHAARNPESFLRLAVAQGYPEPSGSEDTIRRHGEALLAIWRDLSPVTAEQADLWIGDAGSRNDDFAPGLMRRMRDAIDALRPQLGRAVLADRTVLDAPFAFFRLCRKHGYDGPGAGHDLSIENDVNRKMGEKLILAFRLAILD